MEKYGLIGYPLSHSFSPKFFAEKFIKEGIPGVSYDAYPIETIDLLLPLLEANKELKGLNVTIPFKQQVIPFLQCNTNAVIATGACNCIKISKDILSGYNTDVIGFEKSLLPLLKSQHTNALILGTGGAAAAVKYVLSKLGIAYTLVSRQTKIQEGEISYDEVYNRGVDQYKLIINTTPVGMYPAIDSFPGLPYEQLSKQHLLYDLIYNPAETLFLKKGAERGAVVKNGYEMLIIQAEESWKIWKNEFTGNS